MKLSTIYILFILIFSAVIKNSMAQNPDRDFSHLERWLILDSVRTTTTILASDKTRQPLSWYAPLNRRLPEPVTCVLGLYFGAFQYQLRNFMVPPGAVELRILLSQLPRSLRQALARTGNPVGQRLGLERLHCEPTTFEVPATVPGAARPRGRSASE